jgi:hypothetical protein
LLQLNLFFLLRDSNALPAIRPSCRPRRIASLSMIVEFQSLRFPDVLVVAKGVVLSGFLKRRLVMIVVEK